MRRINWKFAAGLAFAFLLSAAAAWGLYVYQSERVAQSLLWQARKYHDDGELEPAIRMAGQYLALRPNDAAVTVELADWQRERGVATRKQLGGIAGLYEKALRVNSDDVAIRRKTAETYIKLGRYGEALDHIERLLPAFPKDAELLTQAGWCQQAAGKIDVAANHYRRAIEVNAQHVPAYISLAGLQANQQKNIEESEVTITKAVATNPDSPEARATLAAHFRRQRRVADASREVNEGLRRSPENATLLFTASDIASAAGDLKQSRALLERGCTAHPTDARFICALAWQLLYDGHADLAVQKLRAGKTTNPNDIDILTLLGDILAQDGQIAPLEQALRELQEVNAPPEKVQPRIRYIEARLAMRRGRFGDAVKILEGLRAVAQRMPSLHRQVNALLAQCAEQLGDATGHIDALKRLLEQDPNGGAVRLEYVRALARAGRHDEALRDLLAVATRPEVASRYVLQATRTLIECARPNAVAWAELQKGVDALKFDDANPNRTIVRAELDRVRNRPDAALAQLVRNISQQPRNVVLHVERALLFELKFGGDRALAALAEAEQWTGDQADLRALRARLIAARSDRTRASVLAALGNNVESFLADDRLAVLREVVAGLRLLDDSAGVARTLERLVIVRPDDFACREALFSIALRQHDDARRDKLLAEIEALEGKDGGCRARLDAQRLIWDGGPEKLAQATARLTAAAEHRPMDPAIPFLRGRIAEISGQADAARDQYRLAFRNGFLSQPHEELLLDVGGADGRLPITVIREEFASHLNLDTPAAMVVCALPILDNGARVQLADRLVAECPPDHAANQAWLGRLFSRMGLPNKAETALRRSASANPQSHDGWAAIIKQRLASNDVAQLNATLAEVRQALPPIEANLLIGRGYESVQRFVEARQSYEAAAAMKPDDPRALRSLAGLALVTNRPADARTALEALARLPDSSSVNDIRWARRNLALQLALTPSLADFRRAMELLERNKVGEGWLADDIRARALVMATQKTRPVGDGRVTARQQAIQLLEALQGRASSRSADDALVLAKLYRAENNETKFQQTCERLAAENMGHSGSVAFLTREAIRNGDVPAAEKLLAALRRLDASPVEIMLMETELRAVSGDAEAACRLLRELIAAAPSPRDRGMRSWQAACFIGDLLQVHPLTNRANAAQTLRTFAIEQLTTLRRMDSDGLQRFVTLLAQDGRLPAALEFLRGCRGAVPADVVAAAQVVALRHGKPTPQQVQAVETSLRDEIAKNPISTALRVSLADLYQQSGRLDQAVTGYREVLQRESNNVVALNNLAWTLAAKSQPSPEALSLIERAIDLVGPLDELLDTRARIRFAAGDPAAGVRDLAEAIAEAPTASRLVDLAAMHRKAGQIELADRAMKKAQQFGVGADTPR